MNNLNKVLKGIVESLKLYISQAIKDTIGTGTLETSSKTIIPAINEVNTQCKDIAKNKKDKLYDKKLSNAIKEKELNEYTFYRIFSKSSYKDIVKVISEVSYLKDFRSVLNSNLYNYATEGATTSDYLFKDNYMKITNNNDISTYHKFSYFVGRVKDFVNYEIKVSNISSSDNYNNRVGLRFIFNNSDVQFISISHDKANNKLLIQEESFVNWASEGTKTLKTLDYVNELSLLVQYCGDKFEIYTKVGDNITYQATKVRTDLRKYCTIPNIYNCFCQVWGILKGGGSTYTISNTRSYIDCGIAQSDIRPVKYEDGSPIISEGKMYFTVSARTQLTAYQSVISWDICTYDISMEGLILFSYDGLNIFNDVASCLVYDRFSNEWIIWNTAHNSGHISARTKLNSDIRFGYNIVKTNFVATERYDSDSKKYVVTDDKSFYGKSGDEDIDIIFDKVANKWYLTLCRLSSSNGDAYSYFLYESDNPIDGFVFKGKTTSDNVTGGNIVKFGNEYHFVCGANETKSQYNIYKLNDLSTKIGLCKFDINDGGYRGWGTLIPIPSGNFTKYIFVTFDREQYGTGNWSYGNLYFYELNVLNTGYEYDLTYNI